MRANGNVLRPPALQEKTGAAERFAASGRAGAEDDPVYAQHGVGLRAVAEWFLRNRFRYHRNARQCKGREGAVCPVLRE